MSVMIIAEAGVNHNGDLGLAKDLIAAASTAGADVIKFQAFSADKIVGKKVGKARYQMQNDPSSDSQHAMLKKLELNERDFATLQDACKKHKITFMASTFGLEATKLLAEKLKNKIIKVGSGELTNAPLLLDLAQRNVEIILSTGMAYLAEVEDALKVLAYGYSNAQLPQASQDFDNAYIQEKMRAKLKDKVTLLHCTTDYPCPYGSVNLNAMHTLKAAFGLKVGYSDHTQGTHVACAAVALGAEVIEKHFTLDKSLPGPDHKASLEPDELAAMVTQIRHIEQARGNGVKAPQPEELKTAQIVRKTVVAARKIRKGELFTLDNLTTRRMHRVEMAPLELFNILNKPAPVDYEESDLIEAA